VSSLVLFLSAQFVGMFDEENTYAKNAKDDQHAEVLFCIDKESKVQAE